MRLYNLICYMFQVASLATLPGTDPLGQVCARFAKQNRAFGAVQVSIPVGCRRPQDASQGTAAGALLRKL